MLLTFSDTAGLMLTLPNSIPPSERQIPDAGSHDAEITYGVAAACGRILTAGFLQWHSAYATVPSALFTTVLSWHASFVFPHDPVQRLF
jgi:hypothetical protein